MAAEHLHHIGGVDRDDPGHGLQAAEHRGNTGENREKATNRPRSNIRMGTVQAVAKFVQGKEGSWWQGHRMCVLSAIGNTRVSAGRRGIVFLNSHLHSSSRSKNTPQGMAIGHAF
jgi:hypothetical protein